MSDPVKNKDVEEKEIDAEEYPRIRPVDAHPVSVHGQRMVLLKDPHNYTGKTLALPPETYYIVSMFDGKHTIRDIQVAYVRKFGGILLTAKIAELVRKLDDHLFLDSDKFRALKEKTDREFVESGVRPALHSRMAVAIPGMEIAAQKEPRALYANYLNYFFRAIEGDPETSFENVRGIISPHIDFQRGGVLYAQSFRELKRASRARIFFVFGTSHTPIKNYFALTGKDFETPLGTVTTDKEIMEKIKSTAGAAFFEDEAAHRSEHSIEFQMVFLRHIFQGKNISAVPILCRSLDDTFSGSANPSSLPGYAEFIGSLKEIIAQYAPEETAFIAGADLSHIGLQFGDAAPPTSYDLKRAEEYDLDLLKYIANADAETFYETIARGENKSNICGLPPIYAALLTFAPHKGALLNYKMCVDPQNLANVSIAGMAFE